MTPDDRRQYGEGIEEVEHMVGRLRAGVSGVADGGGDVVGLSLGPVPRGYRWLIDLMTCRGDGDPGCLAFIDVLGRDENLVWAHNDGETGQLAHNLIVVNEGERLVFDIFGSPPGVSAGVHAQYRLVKVELRRWAREPVSDAAAGFPAPPDAEPGTPAYDAPDAQTLHDRDPDGAGAGAATRELDRAGYGAGALYPGRPDDPSAPAPFPWPDGPAIPGGDF